MEKINIAKLLKDCPKGMELNCCLFNGLEFDHIDTSDVNYPIRCRAKSSKGEYHIHSFTKYGFYNDFFDYSKCVIFPKGKTAWEGFVPPCKFKDADIIYNRLQKKICIYYLCEDEVHCIKDCRYNEFNKQFEKLKYPIPIVIQDYRIATEEEKQKLFQEIKDNGYKWNEETKTLEKLITPKFKVGDIIQDKDSYKVKITNIDIEDRFYTYESLIAKGIGTITFKDQDDWELVSNKFDISTLKPFDRVLVRDSQHGCWIAVLFSHIGNNKNYPYVTSYNTAKYCIPYNVETKHLVGTTLEEPEFYKL